MKKEDLTFTAPFTLTATRDDCEYHYLIFTSIRRIALRYPCISCLVRYFFRLYAQKSSIFHRTACAIYTLEVSEWPHGTNYLFIPVFLRQTVFYTPSTVTISEGQKLIGNLSCAPNARNNRDLDISVSFKLATEQEATKVEYKMCVVLPYRYHNCGFC